MAPLLVLNNSYCPVHEPQQHRTVNFSPEELKACFHMSMNEASAHLGVCKTVLKRRCRQLGIARWPARKLKSVHASLALLEQSDGVAVGKADNTRLRDLHHELLLTQAQILQDPNSSLKRKTRCVERMAAAATAPQGRVAAAQRAAATKESCKRSKREAATAATDQC